jgi:AraC-like DNA-binding protein
MTTKPPAESEGMLRRWRSPDLPGFEICYCNRAHYDGANRYVFDTYTLTLVETGTGLFRRNRQTVQSASTDISVSTPGDVISADSGNDVYTCRSLYLAPDFLDGLTEDVGRSRAYSRVFASMQPGNIHFFQALLRATHALESVASRLELETRLLPALRAFATGQQATTVPPFRPRHRAVRRVRELLLDRLAENVSLDELETTAGLNKFHLLRVFRTETGLPPHTYQQHARVGRARALISRGYTAHEAALETGFADHAHFTRVFKRHLGITPSQYSLSASGRYVNFVQGRSSRTDL